MGGLLVTGGGEAAARQCVVLGEVARLGAAFGDRLPQFVGGLFGYVLVEPAGLSAGEQNALDGAVLQGTVGQRVRERRQQVGGIVAVAQRQHLARVVAGRAGRVLLQRRQEGGGRLTESAEGASQLVECRAALGMWWTMSVDNGLQLGTPRQQRVARDTAQIGRVDEQLLLGDAHRQDVGDVRVGQRIPIALRAPGRPARCSE
jgi:hypothetical protein